MLLDKNGNVQSWGSSLAWGKGGSSTLGMSGCRESCQDCSGWKCSPVSVLDTAGKGAGRQESCVPVCIGHGVDVNHFGWDMYVVL